MKTNIENSADKYYINEKTLKEFKTKYELNEPQTIFLSKFSYEQRLNGSIIKFALDLVQMLNDGKHTKQDVLKHYDTIGEVLPRINMYEVRELLKLVFCLSGNAFEVLKEKFYTNEEKISSFEITLNSCSDRVLKRSRH